jgi:hypothetical protein
MISGVWEVMKRGWRVMGSGRLGQYRSKKEKMGQEVRGVHTHPLPAILASSPEFKSTQDIIRDTLVLLAQRKFCHHLEIETYTWSVLPEELKENVFDSITREYAWVLKNML